MTENYSLNEQTLNFVNEYEQKIEYGTTLTTNQLVEGFAGSTFYKDVFRTYSDNALNKSIWYALKRSGQWLKIKNALYQKTYTPDHHRNNFIRYLSENLYSVLLMKRDVKDEVLKNFYLSSKGIGDDLYYLTEGYYRQKGTFKGKYRMSDFITIKAKDALEIADNTIKLKYEHMVPKNIYIKQIVHATITGALTEKMIYDLLNKYYYVCTVTEEEDKMLSLSSMPISWDELNPFYRYESVGIKYLATKQDSR